MGWGNRVNGLWVSRIRPGSGGLKRESVEKDYWNWGAFGNPAQWKNFGALNGVPVRIPGKGSYSISSGHLWQNCVAFC